MIYSLVVGLGLRFPLCTGFRLTLPCSRKCQRPTVGKGGTRGTVLGRLARLCTILIRLPLPSLTLCLQPGKILCSYRKPK